MANSKATSPVAGCDCGETSPPHARHSSAVPLAVTLRPKRDTRKDSFLPVVSLPSRTQNGAELISFEVVSPFFRPQDVPRRSTYTVTVEVGAPPAPGRLAWIVVDEDRSSFDGQREMRLVFCESEERFSDISGAPISLARRPFCIGPVIQELISTMEQTPDGVEVLR